MKLRILIADDHEVVREGVRALLAREPGWEICATAASAQAAIESPASNIPMSSCSISPCRS